STSTNARRANTGRGREPNPHSVTVLISCCPSSIRILGAIRTGILGKHESTRLNSTPSTPPHVVPDTHPMAYDEDLADRLRDCLLGETGLTEKRMFGGLAFMIDGHMAVSASGHGGLLLRVDPAQTDSLVAEPHAARFV